MSVTKQFSNAFDVSDSKHVLWLKELHMSTLAEKSPEALMTNNPFAIKVTEKNMLDWIDIMFATAMKYAMAVLEGRAWLPPSPAK